MDPSRHPRRRPRSAVAAALTLTAFGILAGVGPASATASQSPEAGARGTGCVKISLVELTEQIYSSEPPTSTGAAPVGDMAIYLDPLNSPAGQGIGTSAGQVSILYQRPSDGHQIELIAETLQFSDGSVFTSGTYDRTEVLGEQWVSAPIKGVSGRYLGLSGTWTWRLTSHVAPFPVQEDIVLCGGR